MKATIKLLQGAPVIGTTSDLERWTEEEILKKAKPRPLPAEGFDYKPFFFLRTRRKTYVFTGLYKDPADALGAAEAAHKLFGGDVHVEPLRLPRFVSEMMGEGPSAAEEAGDAEQLILPLTWQSHR